MADRKTAAPETDTALLEDLPPLAVPMVRHETLPGAPTWTIDAAFSVLRQALAAHYQDDNMAAYLQAMELQIIYDNAGGNCTHQNCVTAWRLLIPLLEQAVGANLRVT